MKLTIFFALFLVVFIAYTQAQGCPGQPRQQLCQGNRNDGRGGRGCRAREMWYYNTRDRTCKKLPYKGCGGNSNRYCTKRDCERKCRRRT